MEATRAITPIRSLLSLSLRAPSIDELEAMSTAAAQLPFTYGPVGGTRDDELPDGWGTDVERVVLGRGRDLWARARDAMFDWRQLDVPWLRSGRKVEPQPDTAVTFSANVFGLWLTQSCRVVFHQAEETDTDAVAGFAWGTVGVHPLAGEERFIVRWNAGDDKVVAEIRKFSRPAHPAIGLVGPIVRHLQRRFSRDALAALSRSVQ